MKVSLGIALRSRCFFDRKIIFLIARLGLGVLKLNGQVLVKCWSKFLGDLEGIYEA